MASWDGGLGPYAITGILGRGAMGVVYAGRGRDTGLAAAVKTAAGADPIKIAQIRQEIHALARLSHPGVVKILDHGVEGGQPWYAMELLAGATLRDVFRGYWHDYATGGSAGRGSAAAAAQTSATLETLGSLVADAAYPSAPPGSLRAAPGGHEVPLAAGGRLTQALSVVQRLCDTLAYVHGEGVVHRDIKPSNIFVRENGLPVLVDFGLTAEVGGTTGREVIGSLERAAGSLAYMAPEQIRGEPLDARCDLYALGCVVYELVTGRPPYIGTMDEIMQGHLRGDPLPPSALAEGVSEPLEALLMDLLAQDRDRRLGYAEDLAHRLATLGALPPPWDGALPPSRAYLYRPAFVGRAEILARLDARLSRPLDGRGGLIFVGAESGAGKTRLALEVAARARRSAIEVISGECVAVSGGTDGVRGVHSAPLHPLRSWMDGLIDRCLQAGPATAEALLGDRIPLLAPYFPRLTHLPGCANLPAPTPLPAEAARGRLFKALAETFAASAAGTPTLLVLDDLQWADELTLGLLAQLGRDELGRMPLLILGTFRSDEAPEQLQELIECPLCEVLKLERMNREDVGRLTGAMLALPEPPAELVDFLADKSQGNPFFVAEYMRSAIAEQVLIRDARGCWRFADTATPDRAVFESLPLPKSLRQMVELRLARLSPASQAVLAAAAIMGRVFEIEILPEVLGIDEAQMFAALDELIRRQIVEPGEDVGFRFIHDKLHEIPAARLPRDERRSLHRRIAQAIESHFRNDPSRETRRAALGLHWSGAGVPERAAPELIKAGDRAQGYNAVDEALRLYQAAVREIHAAMQRGRDDAAHWQAESSRVHEKLGDLLALTGRHPAARDAFDRAIAAARAQVDIGRLHRKCGKTWETQHEHEQALHAYALADARLEEVPEGARDGAWRREWIQVALHRIWVHYWRVDVPEMNAELERVRPHVAEHGLPLHRYHYFMSIVLRDYRQDRYRVGARTLADGARMLEAAQESRQGAETAFAHFVLGFGFLFAGALESAEAHLSRARDGCRRIGDVSGETRALAYLVLCYRRHGRVEQTLLGARELLRMAGTLAMQDYVGAAQAGLAWAALKGGDERAARAHAEEALGTWRGLSFPYPFQWSAALTLLRLQARRPPPNEPPNEPPEGPMEGPMELVRLMRLPQQMHLPDPIDDCLAQAIAAWEAHDRKAVRRALGEAVAAAEREGYL